MRDQQLHKILKDVFGYSSFRFEQHKTIHSVLDGHDTLTVMPTGGGKSLCYQIPSLFLDGVTLVISPLISLMHDQVLNLKEHGIEACFLNSSQSHGEKREIKEKIMQGKLKLVYLSPEGILADSMLDFFASINVALIAIDEAHCISQWGHEFRKDYTRLGELKKSFPRTPFLAITATADEKTRLDICRQLGLSKPAIYVSSFDRPNIKYAILEKENEMDQLHQFIKKNHEGETGIVYCLSRKKVEKVAQDLCKLGYNAVCYHAGLMVEERSRAQELFSKEEGIIVVATIAFGMGIDRPDVRFVAHLDLPKSIESYYQETGRAGRDGRASNAWMVYGLSDVVKLSQMLELTDADESYKRVARGKLDSMLSLCEATTCRRQYLLQYFGESCSGQCQNCDACLTPAQTWNATVEAQKVLSTVYRTGQFFGAGHVVDVLRGKQNAKIKEHGHDKLTVYGLGKDLSKKEWDSVIRQLLNRNYLFLKNVEYRSLGLTEKSRDILNGAETLLLRKQNLGPDKAEKNKRPPVKAGKLASLNERQDLFEELRALRNKLAKENGVPSYLIFHDKSLHEMCMFLPRNTSEFLMVNGVGQSKCDKYSKVFLDKILSWT